jgi:predicted RNA-binding protein
MNWSNDPITEQKLREDLYNGNVDGAKEWLREIDSEILKDELREVIREYEGGAR